MGIKFMIIANEKGEFFINRESKNFCLYYDVKKTTNQFLSY